MSRDIRAVSPVIAVILMVAVTVVLSAAVGAFVFNIGEPLEGNSNQMAGTSMSVDSESNTVKVDVIDMGDVDSVTAIVEESPNGNRTARPSPNAVTSVGQTLTITRLESGDDITIIANSSGKRTVLDTLTYTGEPTPISNSYDTALTSRWIANSDSGTIGVEDAHGYDITLYNSTFANKGVTGDQSIKFPEGEYKYAFRNDFHTVWDSSGSSGTVVASFFAEKDTGDGVTIVSQGYHDSSDGTSSSTQWTLGYDPTDGSIALGVYQGTKLSTSSGVAQNGEWHTIAVTWNASGRWIYVDGEVAAQDSVTPLNDATNNAYDFYMGNHGWAIKNAYHNPNFRVDEVRTYSRSLTKGEIQTLVKKPDARLGN